MGGTVPGLRLHLHLRLHPDPAFLAGLRKCLAEAHMAGHGARLA